MKEFEQKYVCSVERGSKKIATSYVFNQWNYSNLVRNKILTSNEAEFSGFRIEEKWQRTNAIFDREKTKDVEDVLTLYFNFNSCGIDRDYLLHI